MHPRDRVGCADAGDNVFSLRIGEEFAVEPGLAGRRVAGEAHPGTRSLALVAEDHLDDVDGGADVVGNLVGAPVDLARGESQESKTAATARRSCSRASCGKPAPVSST